MPLRVGIIGGGPAGALCARLLSEGGIEGGVEAGIEAGIEVAIFDKGRRPGGRLSTREYERAHFDHGAQYMTARDDKLAPRVASWIQAGVLAPWQGLEIELSPAGQRARAPGEGRLVGVPGMSALVKHLSRGLDSHFEARAQTLALRGDQVEVSFDSRPPERFDMVVVAVPAPQAALLLEPWPALAATMAAVRVAPCWACMLELPSQEHITWASARVRDSPIAWIARNQTKPGRPTGEAWVIHASPEWSAEHLEDSSDQVRDRLGEAARQLTGAVGEPRLARAHRWRYALVTEPAGTPCLLSGPIGVCGDGLLGGRVESALVSGAALAERIMAERSAL